MNKNSKKLFTLNQTEVPVSDLTEDKLIDFSIKTNSVQLTSDNFYVLEQQKIKSKVKEYKYTINLLEIQKCQLQNQVEYLEQLLIKHEQKNKDFIQKISNLEVQNKYLKFQNHKLQEQCNQIFIKFDQFNNMKQETQNQVELHRKQIKKIQEFAKFFLSLIQSKQIQDISKYIDQINSSNRELLQPYPIKNSLDAYLNNIITVSTEKQQLQKKLANLQSQLQNQKQNRRQPENLNSNLRLYQHNTSNSIHNASFHRNQTLSNNHTSYNHNHYPSVISQPAQSKKYDDQLTSGYKYLNRNYEYDRIRPFQKTVTSGSKQARRQSVGREYYDCRYSLNNGTKPSKQKIKKELDSINFEISELQSQLIKQLKQC